MIGPWVDDQFKLKVYASKLTMRFAVEKTPNIHRETMFNFTEGGRHLTADNSSNRIHNSTNSIIIEPIGWMFISRYNSILKSTGL